MSSKYSPPDVDSATEPDSATAPRPWHRRALFGAAAAGGVVAGAAAAGWYSGFFGGAPPAAPGPAGGTPGSGQVLTAETERGTVTVNAVGDGVTRVRIAGGDEAAARHSYAIEQDPIATPAELGTEGTHMMLSTAGLSVLVHPTSGAITARSAAGTFVEEAGVGFARSGEGYRWQLALPRDETCHGLGQRAFPLSLRNRRIGLWNYDARSYPPGSDPLYLSVPFYLGHRPGLSYGILWDNPARGSIDLDSGNDATLTCTFERGPVDIYLIAGDGPQQVVQRLAALTGRMELPPLWALGYHQSRWSYQDAAAYRAVAKRMRAERIPCDALHFDIDYMDGFRVFTWDRTKFADPRGLLADLRKDGFQSVAILDPGLKADGSYAAYADARRKGFLLKKPGGGRLTRQAWAGASEFPDFTDPDCRDWWAEQVRSFAAVGFAGLWNDMNEPSTFVDPRTLPDNTPHDWEGEGNTHVGGGHAVYGMQMARASRDGLSRLNGDRRPFVISRAGHTGLQRYATTWNGDSLATWGHLQITIPQLLNLGMSGIPFSGSDAGGFRGDPDAELYLRWMQLASMTPFFRTHSARTAKERNPWTYDTKTTNRVRKVVELRYRLLPYLYTAVQRASAEGVPILRPMSFERPDLADYQRIDDQFMLGDNLLVAPIIEKGVRSRSVVLPEGQWYPIGAGDAIDGGRSITDSVGMGLSVHVRGGTVVPTWPVRQSTSQPVERLILEVYAGTGGGRLYEDAGDGYGYRSGDMRMSTFTTELADRSLTVSWAKEGSFAAPYRNVDVRFYGLPGAPTEVVGDGRSFTGERADGALAVTTGQFDELRVTF